MTWLDLIIPLAVFALAAFAISWQNAADRMQAMLDELHIGERTDDCLDVHGGDDDA